MYKDGSDAGWKLVCLFLLYIICVLKKKMLQSKQFKAAFCANIIVDFIGVFDTVSSVGFLGSKLPFTASNYGIKHFRHAMALDERRARFKVNHWHRIRPECDQGSGITLGKSVRRGHESDNDALSGTEEETDVKEVWFAGGHVGSVGLENSKRFELTGWSSRRMWVAEMSKTTRRTRWRESRCDGWSARLFYATVGYCGTLTV